MLPHGAHGMQNHGWEHGPQLVRTNWVIIGQPIIPSGVVIPTHYNPNQFGFHSLGGHYPRFDGRYYITPRSGVIHGGSVHFATWSVLQVVGPVVVNYIRHPY
ncbi:hypothetical protein HS088_TW05G00205 [Tripterygium wilfordii]|uniref:Uncharacterized protein n=1 Tax=Tripterygium wilfordii TaxID=458696 RepID=A0A7J7DMP2_TRIWF|nr:uncharacterized protein LOC119999027 [Tripterygium wilfordii]XP_038702445.1 uncharacterized protein LOC119999027 [Tripterygium wilfordii]KAF5747484.1 hypothetical protein HS088_TW05G00205 [Tripterygium wilfordii]